MSVQQFCLRWNNHQPNFISVCSSLLHNGTLVDVTLAAEGRQLQAHKIVLSACSSYFQTLFTTNPCQHPIVILKDVQYDDLKTMVDFMYYGEVNVSQEQLPHILKTAEMLKIKGLAEMPTDPANLTKSDSKSSNEPTELVGSGGSNGQSGSGGGVSSGGLGSSTGGSMSDSLWEQQQHHHSQHSETQFQQHHHQQQNSQTQTPQQQQHHQLRRTPSPLGAGASPATRRKRLRKSSNNGSGDRNNSDDQQHNTSLDTNNTSGGISLSQMSQMSFGAGAGSLSGIPGHSLHATKLLKESTSTDVEPHPQDSDSLDDGHGHVHMQIKPEVDMSSVQQSIPLDISGATTPSEHDAPNSQSSHSDAPKSPVAVTTFPADETTHAVNMAIGMPATTLHPQHQHQPQQQQLQQMGTKRNRVLTRQPRVKRDSDSLSNSQISPDPLVTGADFDPFGGNSASSSSHVNYPPSQSGGQSHAHHHHHHHAHQHQLHHHQHHLLTVPPRIERHASEPAPSLTPSSPHLLSVPQNTHFLIKQHSDPLLPSQHSLSGSTLGPGGGSNPFAPLHRQYSHPLSGTSSSSSATSSSNSHITPTASLHHPHHIALPESIYASGSPPPAGSSQYLVPQQSASAGEATASAAAVVVTSSPSPSCTVSPTKALSLPQFTTTYVGNSGGGGGAGGRANSPTSSTATAERLVVLGSNTPPPTAKFRSSKSASGALLSERMSNLHPGTPALTSSSFEHLPSLRVKNEELQRSVSSPQTTREIITLENPRSSHCPVIRPGPALGCNFCWNTIDGHGRILRRKTKYHCPECQTNLCIVPCFQEYHERLNNEAANSSAAPSNDSGKSFAATAASSSSAAGAGGSGSNASRHYSKTESI